MVTNHTLIIAEAGVNHNGSLDLAFQLIEKAAEAGVDYVKFQTFNSSKLVSASASKAEYQKQSLLDDDNSQLSMLKKLELSQDDHFRLIEHCNKHKIKFLSTAFDNDSINFLNNLHLDFWKIPSGEITNLPYLRKIARCGGHVILSTGMCELHEVAAAVDILEQGGINRNNIILLHCNTQYPTPMTDVNLRAMNALQSIHCGSIGYSDHTVGIEVPIAAVALGARVIEKHFTLDKSLPGPDHRASLNPEELAQMVKSIRNIELALGNEIKTVSPSERPNIEVARKSIVAARDIKKGEIFTEENITVKRPGNGISPMKWDDVLGKIASRNFAYDSLIELD